MAGGAQTDPGSWSIRGNRYIVIVKRILKSYVAFALKTLYEHLIRISGSITEVSEVETDDFKDFTQLYNNVISSF